MSQIFKVFNGWVANKALTKVEKKGMICLEISVAGQSYGREGPRSPNSVTQRDALSLLLAERGLFLESPETFRAHFG